MKRTAIALSIAALALTTSSCSSTPASTTTLTVAAAASLTDVFAEIGTEFTATHPDVELRFSFAGSSSIAEQIRSGAPIDVFASAGVASMQPLVDEGFVKDVADIGTNSLMIAVPVGNPGDVTALADLVNVTTVICQEQVPCGAATVKLIEKNALTFSPASLEPDVRAVLTKVIADEADAGIVYVTDVRAAAGDVVGIEIPADRNVTSAYQAAVVAESSNSQAAADFVAFLTSADAQRALAEAGFGAP